MREWDFEMFTVSQAALDCVSRSVERLETLHRRHLGGDWGEGQNAQEWQENDAAKAAGGVTLSIFILSNGEQLWITTDKLGVTKAVAEEEFLHLDLD